MQGGTSMDSSQECCPLSGVFINDNNGTEANRAESIVEEVTGRIGGKQVKQKNIARRGVAFTKDEDKIICLAFLNISKDPITGVNQSTGGYYKRIHEYFCKHKLEGPQRSQQAIQHRWQLIQKAVNKFCGYKSAVDRRNESGKCEQDRIDDAVKMFEKNESFTFMHCWKLLCKEAKWSDQMLELNRPPTSVKGVSTVKAKSDALCMETINENNGLERAEGRDSAKKRRSNGGDASSSNAIEVLQQIHERNGKIEEKQDQQMQEILTMKGEKMKLSEKMYDLQKQDMEKRARLKEEQLSLAKKDIEVRDKQSEPQLLTAELGIMGADLDKLAPQVRAYYIAMQRQIMERRGISIPPNPDE